MATITVLTLMEFLKGGENKVSNYSAGPIDTPKLAKTNHITNPLAYLNVVGIQ